MSVEQQGAPDMSAEVLWNHVEYTFGPSGFTHTKSGKGQHASCLAEAESLQAAGWEGSVRPDGDGPNSIITATISTLDPDNPDAGLVARWELDVQWGSVPAANSQAFLDYIAANGGNSGSTFRAIIAACEQYRTEGIWTLYDALGNATQKAWAFDIINGETVLEADAVLRRLNSYPPNTTLTADWVDVRKIFTTSQLVSLSDPPSAIVGNLPSTYWFKASAGSAYGNDGRYEIATHWMSGSATRYPSHRYTYKT